MSALTIIQSLLLTGFLLSATPAHQSPAQPYSKPEELVSLLKQLAVEADQRLLKMHFESLVTMITDDTHNVDWTAEDSIQAAEVLKFFQNEGAQWETYANGPRPLMMSFISPSDGKNTFYWLFLPKNYREDHTSYPFYMELHGSGGGKNDNPRRMLFHPLQPEIKGVTAQGYRQEGFFIYPWGRGDKFYKGQAELDVLECLAHFDAMFDTDATRQYLYGFSMGGSGVYNLAQKTAERWTALGIYSGAFRDGVSMEAVQRLGDLPVWITWGEEERLAENNRKLKDLLMQHGNEVRWAEVKGVGHSYLGEYQEDLMDWLAKHEK